MARIDARTCRDQLVETGHDRREADIALLGSLGVRATRYPILWERTAPRAPGELDLSWARRRLELLAQAGIEPIVTLLHHGSGPRYTNLLDPAFPELFAAYAGKVAAAFPHVRRWTPINEPLTTARFSTLYGHWYPNALQDLSAFGRAVVNQARATVLAMAAIRERVPGAQLVTTEDLQGFTALSRRARRYVEEDRERTYLSNELVMGRIRPGHAMHRFLTESCNVSRAELDALASEGTAPDLVGWNYYPYSERAIDVAVSGEFINEPAWRTAAISPRPLLEAAHQRLGLPFGLSEVHVDADEASRVRWLLLRYADALALSQRGLPVRMVGAWAAFGMIDWEVLLIGRAGHREDGIFTFAGEHAQPQETAVAAAVRRLVRGEPPPLPERAGWWESGAASPAGARG